MSCDDTCPYGLHDPPYSDRCLDRDSLSSCVYSTDSTSSEMDLDGSHELGDICYAREYRTNRIAPGTWRVRRMDCPSGYNSVDLFCCNHLVRQNKSFTKSAFDFFSLSGFAYFLNFCRRVQASPLDWVFLQIVTEHFLVQ